MCLSLYLMYVPEENHAKRFMFDTVSLISNPVSNLIDASISYIQDVRQAINHTWVARKENIALKLENAKLNNLLQEASKIHSENISLKKHIKFKDNDKYKIFASGRLISTYSNIYSRGGVLNLGASDGVQKNQVLVSDGNIIGKTSYISNYFSKITFVTDVNSRIPIITSISAEKAILAGSGDGKAKLLYAADKHKIKAGEIIISSGDGKYYPYGIPIARVIRVEGNQIDAKPLISVDKIRFATLLEVK